MIGLLVPVIAGGGFVGNVTLSGDPGAPNEGSALANPGNTVVWTFKTDGTVEVNSVQFQAGVEWNDLQPNVVKPLYIRATHNVGDTPSSGTLDTWLQLSGSGSTDRAWVFVSDGDPSTGSIQIQIARGSSGSGVLATGYYGARFTSV